MAIVKIPEKTFPFTLLSSANSTTVTANYQAAIDNQAGTQLAKSLAVSAYMSFIIPGALDADYIAASQDKKEVMAQICQEAIASGQDFDTYYTNRYNELYP